MKTYTINCNDNILIFTCDRIYVNDHNCLEIIKDHHIKASFKSWNYFYENIYVAEQEETQEDEKDMEEFNLKLIKARAKLQDALSEITKSFYDTK